MREQLRDTLGAARRVLRTREAARYLGLSDGYLEKARLGGDGPPFVRLGARSVGYDVRDLDDWIEDRKTANTAVPRRPARR